MGQPEKCGRLLVLAFQVPTDMLLQRAYSCVHLAFKRTTESSMAREEVAFSLVDAFAVANIPLEKLDHPKLRDYLNQ